MRYIRFHGARHAAPPSVFSPDRIRLYPRDLFFVKAASAQVLLPAGLEVHGLERRSGMNGASFSPTAFECPNLINTPSLRLVDYLAGHVFRHKREHQRTGTGGLDLVFDVLRVSRKLITERSRDPV